MAVERADLVDQIGREIEVLERPENAKLVNAERLREAQQKISELFVVSQIRKTINRVEINGTFEKESTHFESSISFQPIYL